MFSYCRIPLFLNMKEAARIFALTPSMLWCRHQVAIPQTQRTSHMQLELEIATEIYKYMYGNMYSVHALETELLYLLLYL